MSTDQNNHNANNKLHQNIAIKTLLDCSNAFAAIKYKGEHQSEQQNICPWITPRNKPNKFRIKTEQQNGNVLKRIKKPIRLLAKPLPWAPQSVTSTPKREKQSRTIHQPARYAFNSIVNLSRQFQLIHNERKNNYLRSHLFLRFKTE